MEDTNKMVTIGEEASQYEKPTTKNITDLNVVSTSAIIEDREGKDANGEPFKYKVIVVDGVDYRVPGSVIGSLKAILDKKPDLKEFSVSKTGQNLDTRYTVIPQ
jgi:hypothetical protein